MAVTKKTTKEYVMVFPTSLLSECGFFQGLNFEYDKYIEIITQSYTYIERNIAEKNPYYKQVIPYVILHHNGTLFSYRRGKLLSETRLTGNFSIGIGGHISIEDENLFSSSYEEALMREVREEIYIETNYEDRMVAVLNDDSNEVGRVHFGIVHLFNLKYPYIKKKEKSINEPNFITIYDLLQNLDKYENWSKICLLQIEKILKPSKVKI